MAMLVSLLLFIKVLLLMPLVAETASRPDSIRPGAYQTSLYFPLLEGKRIAVAGNHTSMIGEVHLVDSLLRAGFSVKQVFSPEHGFRGQAAHGEYVPSATDEATGLPVVSLYGSNRKPLPEQLQGVDVIVFDIQDVGVRFYTYLSTMTYIMEAAAREGIPVVVLDRPNPLGHYVDGPVLEPEHSSFVGLHQVPVVHGLTPGEYALMVNGESWLPEGLQCELTVIPVSNYTRNKRYHLPVPPSPNLPNMHAVYLYPSLCLLEGTVISLGRGTPKPFQIYGHSSFSPEVFPYGFKPESLPAAPRPPQMGKYCQGIDLSILPIAELEYKNQLDLSYLLHAYTHYQDKEPFFNAFFTRLAGTRKLQQQIADGLSEADIRESWQPGLEAFLQLREKYLIYTDE